MKVIRLTEIEGTDRDVFCPRGGFRSLRGLLAKDGMGFSMHWTVIPPNGPQRWHYKNHLEACWCIKGKGLLVDASTRQLHAIAPGSLYVLDKNDEHTFEALEEVTLICVFNPPVTGAETHDADGSYILGGGL